MLGRNQLVLAEAAEDHPLAEAAEGKDQFKIYDKNVKFGLKIYYFRQKSFYFGIYLNYYSYLPLLIRQF